MNYYDPASYRSPETKTEVRQAAKVLIGLRTLFVLGLLRIVINRHVFANPVIAPAI